MPLINFIRHIGNVIRLNSWHISQFDYDCHCVGRTSCPDPPMRLFGCAAKLIGFQHFWFVAWLHFLDYAMVGLSLCVVGAGNIGQFSSNSNSYSPAPYNIQPPNTTNATIPATVYLALRSAFGLYLCVRVIMFRVSWHRYSFFFVRAGNDAFTVVAGMRERFNAFVTATFTNVQSVQGPTKHQEQSLLLTEEGGVTVMFYTDMWMHRFFTWTMPFMYIDFIVYTGFFITALCSPMQYAACVVALVFGCLWMLIAVLMFFVNLCSCMCSVLCDCGCDKAVGGDFEC